MEDYELVVKKYKDAVHENELAIKNYDRAKKRLDKSNESVKKWKKEADQVTKKINIIKDAMDDMRPKQPYTIAELFNKDFLKKHTDYDDCEKFFGASGITPEQLADYKSYPKVMNKLAKEMTDFDTFDDFFKEALLMYNLSNYGIKEVPKFLRDGTELNF